MTKPLSKTMTARIQRLAPNGIPRYVRCYDNGGESGDRYTVVFSGNFPKGEGMNKEFPYLAMSSEPFHPQGIGMHGSIGPWSTPPWNGPIDTIGFKEGGKRAYVWPPALGRKNHLGRRIKFSDLPTDCQICVWQDYADYWSIPNPLSKRKPSVFVQAE